MISFRYGSHRMDMGIKRTEDCRMKDIPSLDTRILGALPKRKAYKSNHIIAPAYNKGAYQVISKDCIKDIGR